MCCDHMPNMTFAIPEKLHNFIKEHREVNWSEIGKRALWDYARKIESMEKHYSKKQQDVPEKEDKTTLTKTEKQGQQNLL